MDDSISKDYRNGYIDGYNRSMSDLESTKKVPKIKKRKSYKFFQNLNCEFFPCHKGIKEKDFNCLFCYCPIYKECIDRIEEKRKCHLCIFPHKRNNYEKILSLLNTVATEYTYTVACGKKHGYISNVNRNSKPNRR